MRRRKRMMDDLDQDIRDHIEMETQDNIERGMSPEAARYAALRKFGNMARVKEETRKVWSHTWLEQFVQDLHFGAGSLRKNPGFATMAILTLALGIGACTAIFSIVNSVLIRSLPYEDASHLVYLFTPIPRFLVPAESMMPSYADFLDLKKQSHSIAAMTDFDQKVFTLTAGDKNRKVGAALVDVRAHHRCHGHSCRPRRCCHHRSCPLAVDVRREEGCPHEVLAIGWQVPPHHWSDARRLPVSAQHRHSSVSGPAHYRYAALGTASPISSAEGKP
jgi:hypothetical protein